MGLFDSIAGQAAAALGKQDGDAGPSIMEAVTGLIGGDKSGGLEGLLGGLKEKGLGDIASSWIGKGNNLPISAAQLQSVLGNEKVQAIAQKLGLSPEKAAEAIAKILPQIVDRLTPNGSVPDNALLKQGLSLLKGFGAKS